MFCEIDSCVLASMRLRGAGFGVLVTVWRTFARWTAGCWDMQWGVFGVLFSGAGQCRVHSCKIDGVGLTFQVLVQVLFWDAGEGAGAFCKSDGGLGGTYIAVAHSAGTGYTFTLSLETEGRAFIANWGAPARLQVQKRWICNLRVFSVPGLQTYNIVISAFADGACPLSGESKRASQGVALSQRKYKCQPWIAVFLLISHQNRPSAG